MKSWWIGVECRGQSLDGWFDRVEYVSERLIVRESRWSGGKVVSGERMKRGRES